MKTELQESLDWLAKKAVLWAADVLAYDDEHEMDAEIALHVGRLRKELERAAKVIPDREHIVQVSHRDAIAMAEFLSHPNGAMWVNRRMTLEAVQGGGVLVRTQPYRHLAERIEVKL